MIWFGTARICGLPHSLWRGMSLKERVCDLRCKILPRSLIHLWTLGFMIDWRWSAWSDFDVIYKKLGHFKILFMFVRHYFKAFYYEVVPSHRATFCSMGENLCFHALVLKCGLSVKQQRVIHAVIFERRRGRNRVDSQGRISLWKQCSVQVLAIQMWSAGLAVLTGRVGMYEQLCGRMLAPPPALTEKWQSVTLMPFVTVAPITYVVQLKNNIFWQFSTEVDMQSFQQT